ncbi:MAG: radical SAM protein [Sandaracinaceae bacterium]|nr:radical SAM protein [Sandaracinaceae bacterium]
MKALIKVGYGCNDHCTFCHTLDVRHVEGEAAEVHAKIERAAALGHTMVVLSGGEPTIRPELVRWAEHVRSLGLGFGLVTNGRMLRYPELVERLGAARLEYVYLSLHGGSAKTHNLMVRSEAFDETVAGLRNVAAHAARQRARGQPFDLTVNCVITRHNVEHLRALVELVVPITEAKLKLSMVEPKGGADRSFEHLVPRVAHVGRRVAEALDHGRALVAEGARTLDGRSRLLHGGVPLCLVPGWEDAFDDLRTHGFRSMVEIGEADFFPVDDLNKVQPSACEGCTLRGPCPGLYRAYEASFGADELQPRRDGTRGNSFDFVAERIVRKDLPEAITTETCPVRPLGITPWDHARDLHVRHGPRLVRFRAEGRDASDAELTALRTRSGQLYLDVSETLASSDFSKDLRAVTRSPICAACEDRPRCSGLFEVSSEDVFSRDDARVRERLSRITGDVLDVGCGELRYAAELDREDVRYVGLDPDEARLATLRSRMPRAESRLGTADGIEDDAAFDVVLVLHAWNHVRDPEDLVRRARRALRVGGRLIVVDDQAFALLRSRPRARRAHAAQTLAFEHHRLDDAEACARRLAAGGLTVTTQLEVAAGTSNQWIVEAVR